MKTMKPIFFAATASARRHRILEDLGVEFEVFVPECAEINDDSDPVLTVYKNALVKHNACRRLKPEAWILAADTVVAVSGLCLGKPSCKDTAAEMLMSLAGKTHMVFTGVAVSRPSHEVEVRVAASSVTFKNFDSATAAEYLAIAKTHDRAGAYDIDACGDMIIASHSGSRTNIMGLPDGIVRDWLTANGYYGLKDEVAAQ